MILTDIIVIILVIIVNCSVDFRPVGIIFWRGGKGSSEKDPPPGLRRPVSFVLNPLPPQQFLPAD